MSLLLLFKDTHGRKKGEIPPRLRKRRARVKGEEERFLSIKQEISELIDNLLEDKEEIKQEVLEEIKPVSVLDSDAKIEMGLVPFLIPQEISNAVKEIRVLLELEKTQARKAIIEYLDKVILEQRILELQKRQEEELIAILVAMEEI